ncbi:MAG: signal peptidase II [Gemmatimonadota bacterium]
MIAGHLTTLSRIALIVALGDLLTKFAAAQMVSGHPGVGAVVSFAVVHNPAGAFGWSAGSYTWQLNLALTLAAVVFVIPVTRDLARIDARAPIALGLIAGGALGNLVSLISSPKGVVDFIQVHWSSDRALILNVADLAAYSGLFLLARTAYLIVRAIQRQGIEARAGGAATPEPAGPVGSVFDEKARAKRSIKRLRIDQPIPYLGDSLTADWSIVSEIRGVLADAPADGPRRDPTSRDETMRPMGVPPRRKLRLEPIRDGELDPTREIRPE